MTSNYTNTKLTENEVIDLLKSFLEQNGWEIKCYCKGQQHGYDIFAEKDGQTLVVEAKGAKAADNSPTKKRAYFSNTQIEVHFGKAIIQILKIK